VSAISVEHLSRWWGVTRAVDDVSFEAAAGRMLVLLGPSGCGKSTTLRLIAGLETATHGRIAIGGVDVTHRPPAERRVSMVFQSYALFPHLSVAENIVFGLRVRRVDAAERRARLARVADLLANLDAQLRLDMRREIRGLQQSLGITMVYVTHDQTEAMSMADQVILLREGRVEQDAPPEALYARPATAFAARFIGTPPMNVLALADRRRLLGVRPEDVRIGAEGERGAVEATVRSIEYLGADSILMCALGAQALAVRAPGRVRLAPGACVHLAWAPEAAHVFEAETGRRLDDVAADSPISR
jgi:sn-glycerol 3-phosphate transport system ATP-binding protein